MPWTYLISLLQTVMSASFLLFPFATILSHRALHCGLWTLAVKLHKNKWFLTIKFPVLLMRDLPLTLLPELRSFGANPKNEDIYLQPSKSLKLFVVMINNIAVFLLIPEILLIMAKSSGSWALINSSICVSKRLIYFWSCFNWRFKERIIFPLACPLLSKECSLFNSSWLLKIKLSNSLKHLTLLHVFRIWVPQDLRLFLSIETNHLGITLIGLYLIQFHLYKSFNNQRIHYWNLNAFFK